MIVYKCNAKWAMSRRFRRYVKTRTSDKNKRAYQKIQRYRGDRYWWKPVQEENLD